MSLTQKIFEDFLFNQAEFLKDFLIPCIFAIIFGGIIGFQREKTDRPAGLRTHTLVCLGATVFTIVSYVGFSSFSGVDYSRIAAGVVTGIGFIGAGAIFRRGPLVKGVTTAASIWLVAAIGLALGTKLYYLAAILTIFGYIILTLIKYFEKKFFSPTTYSIKITVEENFKDFKKINRILEKISDNIKYNIYRAGEEEATYNIVINVQSRDSEFSLKSAKAINKFENIRNIEISQF
ncbi:MAG: MgtC/SapB family protein [Actinomycetota bacterium]